MRERAEVEQLIGSQRTGQRCTNGLAETIIIHKTNIQLKNDDQ